MLFFWILGCMLCTLLAVSASDKTVEDVWMKLSDTGTYSHGQKTQTESSGSHQTKEWIDPFDMTCYSHAEKRMVKEFFSQEGERESDTKVPQKTNDNKLRESCHCKGNNMERNFLQRFVNLLINHCENSRKDISQEISIILKISPEQLQELYRLRNAADSEAAIRLLNGIVSYMMPYDRSNIFPDITISEEVWSNIGIISFAMLPLCIFILGGTLRRVMCILILSVFAVGYYKTYKLMLKKLELQNENTLKHTDCNPYGWSWYHMIFGSNSETECLKQLHALKIEPSLEITPVNVISHMLAVGSFQPLEQFGIMFSQFSKQIFESHSVLYGIFVFLIAVFILIYIITMCFAGIFGRNLSIGNKHISLGITNTAQPNAERKHASSEFTGEQQTSMRPLSEVSPTKHEEVHRPIIQIIHNYPNNNNAVVPIIQNDPAVKHLVYEKDVSNNTEMKSTDSQEEPKKIQDITVDNSDTKKDTSERKECVDDQIE